MSKQSLRQEIANWCKDLGIVVTSGTIDQLLQAFSKAVDEVIGEDDIHHRTQPGLGLPHRYRNNLRAEQRKRKSEVIDG